MKDWDSSAGLEKDLAGHVTTYRPSDFRNLKNFSEKKRKNSLTGQRGCSLFRWRGRGRRCSADLEDSSEDPWRTFGPTGQTCIQQ